MKKNIKKVKKYQKPLICLIGILGFVLGVTVEKIMKANADEINYEYVSDSIGYNNEHSTLNATNVKDAIDELYAKVGQCPNGYNCLTDAEFLTTGSKILRAYTYNENSCITGNEAACERTTCYGSKTIGSCPVGTIIDYFVNDTTKVRFHVLHDDGETMTMQTQQNTVYNVKWWSGGNDRNKGPQTIMAKLKEQTDDWTNVSPINITESTTSFTGVDSMDNLCTNDSEGNVTCSGNQYDIGKIAGTYRARMITLQEATNPNIGQCLSYVSENLYNKKTCRMFMNNFLYNSDSSDNCKRTELCVADNYTTDGLGSFGYWTMNATISDRAWRILNVGCVYYREVFDIGNGARAVVVVNK